MKSPRPTLYEHSETPGGSVYWVPHVDERITVPEEGKSYDTIDEAIEMYSNYAEAAGFQIKKAGQKTNKSGIVTLKYLMCNKEGAPRHVNIDTLDAKHSGKQKRQTTIHVTGIIDLEAETESIKVLCLLFGLTKREQESKISIWLSHYLCSVIKCRTEVLIFLCEKI
ncbi:FAR1 DNA binding domain-containing protein [Artemisia annua]|uniref:FAR1 DNA binding domain-containing protein n=1 Tax=Artemisia annua TaxID=35608 RepID=A0A2U1M8T9_ARTAN|nr:FAR1 DNA binding domain-containing protein [Artemisia annua]